MTTWILLAYVWISPNMYGWMEGKTFSTWDECHEAERQLPTDGTIQATRCEIAE